MRDLARKRMFLVQHKTAHILSLQSLIARCCAVKVSANDMRHLTVKDLQKLLKEEHLVLSAQANLDTIGFLAQQIKRIEKAIHKKVKDWLICGCYHEEMDKVIMVALNYINKHPDCPDGPLMLDLMAGKMLKEQIPLKTIDDARAELQFIIKNMQSGWDKEKKCKY